jgi:hypothetical protein
MGKEFWQPLLEFMSERLVKGAHHRHGRSGKNHRDRFPPRKRCKRFTEVGKTKNSTLTYGARMKRRWIFGEREAAVRADWVRECEFSDKGTK